MINIKKGTVATLCMIMVGLFFAFGCKKDPVTSGGGTPPGGEEPTYPIEIPFEEYSLEGTSCQWTNLAYDNTVIVIDSDEKMNRYIACTGSDYPEIDFETQTLLLASGKTEKGISEITVNSLQQLSADKYELNMELLLNDETITEEWAVALIIEKVSESMVELIVIEYPIEILFEEYFIHWERSSGYWEDGIFYSTFPCWKNLNHEHCPDYVWGGKISIINNSEELENYFNCPEDFPVIDFSRHTLVLTSGITGRSISSIHGISEIVFFKNGANQYAMEATISQGITADGNPWCIAILTPKIEDDATIMLEIFDRPKL